MQIIGVVKTTEGQQKEHPLEATEQLHLLLLSVNSILISFKLKTDTTHLENFLVMTNVRRFPYLQKSNDRD